MKRSCFVTAIAFLLSMFLFQSVGAQPLHPQATPTPRLSTSFQVLVSRGRATTIGSTPYYVVEGVLKNTGTVNVKYIYVRAQIFWTGGSLQGEAVYNADIPVLRPGETSSFRVYVNHAAPSTIDYYQVSIIGSETTEEPYRDLVVINDHMVVSGSQRILRGEILNTGNRTADNGYAGSNKYTNLYTILYDSTGRIVEYYADSVLFAGHLNPGQTDPFAYSTSIFTQVARWEYWIRSTPLPSGTYAPYLLANLVSTQPQSGGALTIRGTITNHSNINVDSCRLVVTFRDTDHKVIGDDLGYPCLNNPIQPGATINFERYIFSFDVPSSYASIDVQARSEKTTNQAPPTPTSTATSPATATVTPTTTSTYTVTPTETPSKTPTVTLTPTWTLTPTDRPSVTRTQTATISPTPSATFYPTPIGGYPHYLYLPAIVGAGDLHATPVPLPTPTATTSPTQTTRPSDTPTNTLTTTATHTSTIAPTPTYTPIPSSTPTFTLTPTPTLTATSSTTPTITPTAKVAFFENVEAGINSWVADHNRGGRDWTITDGQSHSPSHSWYGPGSSNISDLFVISPPIQIEGGVILAFWHRYDLEMSSLTARDGGVVEISSDNGVTWSDLGQYMTRNGYNYNTGITFGHPLDQRNVFSGRSDGWIDTRVNLASFVGQTVRIRFRLGTDSSITSSGWWVDDVYVGPVNLIPHTTFP